MVDVERVTRLFEVIRTEIAALRRLGSITGLDEDQIAAVKYRFIVAIEGAIDVGQHVIASEQLPTAATFSDVFVRLGETGWLDADVASSLSDAARFRNLLVHGYADVDDARVLVLLGTGPNELELFVQQLAGRLADT